MTTSLRIDVWSDIACPWCYVGKRHLEQALAEFPHAKDVEIVWRAFELDPSAPRVRDQVKEPYYLRLANKYGWTQAQAEARHAQMVATGAADGIEFRFDRIQSGNTFDAHRLLHLAHEHGTQDALKERMMRAYMTEGAAIGDPEVLAGLAKDVGLDEAEARALLAGDRYAAEVRADERLARELGINGVPFFVLSGKLGVSGAQPAQVLRGALEQAWAEHVAGDGDESSMVEGAACGPDGCS